MDVRGFFGRRRARTVVKGRVVKVLGSSRPAAKSIPPRARKAVASIAKRVMRKNIETKYVSDLIGQPEGVPFELYGSVVPTLGVPQLYTACPAVTVGDNGYQRTGQQINPVRHTCTLDVEFNNLRQDITGGGGLDACAWDITCHIWYGYARRYKSQVDLQANAAPILQTMFEDGDGTSSPFTGAPHDALKKINSDMIVVKKKSFRMWRPFGAQNQATLAGGLTTYFPQTIKKRVKLVYKPPKTLRYDEAAIDPENYAPFFIIGYEHNDATQASNNATPSAPASILTKPALQFVALQEMWFKDA